MAGNPGFAPLYGTQSLPENHGHRAGSGIVSEKSFLSYYKTEFLRVAASTKTGNGMREQAHWNREGDRAETREAGNMRAGGAGA
jgi:hypothetical protein